MNEVVEQKIYMNGKDIAYIFANLKYNEKGLTTNLEYESYCGAWVSQHIEKSQIILNIANGVHYRIKDSNKITDYVEVGEGYLKIGYRNDTLKNSILKMDTKETFIPYTNLDWKEFLGKVFINNINKLGYIVTSYTNKGVFIDFGTEKKFTPYATFISDYKTLNDKPAGKKL